MVVYTSKKPFECPECRKRFSNHRKMDKHMMVCTGEKPDECPNIAVYLDFSKVFDRVPHGRLVKKIEGHGIGGCYVKLDGCAKGNRKLVQMGLSQSGEIVPLIGKSFSKHRNMNNYTMVVYTSKKPFECPECRKRFSNHRKMDKHMIVCTREKPDECPKILKPVIFPKVSQLVGISNVPLIGKNFSKHRNMNNYTMVVYTSKKPFECPECRKRFSNHRKMDKHMMVCTGEKPDECPKIKKGFVITYLICKKNRILKPVIFPKVSQLVGISNIAVYLEFSKVFDRVPHGRLVKKVEGHGIGGCYVKLDGCTKGNRNVPLIGKSFSKHRNMNNYTMVVYTSKKPFECPECRKRFSNHRKMDKHMMVCTGEKPDECPKIKKGFVITYLICKKNRILKPVIFPKVSQLVGISNIAVYLEFSKVFDRVPHGRLVKKIEGHGIGGCYVKLDGCTKGNRNVPLIGKSFSKHRNMNNYTMVVYTSKKPFECPECRKRFSNHRKMDKHMMVCTGEKPDECPKIKKGFVITYLICKKNRILKPVIFPKVSQLVGISNIAVYLEFSKVFDRVPHGRLVKKIEGHGIGGCYVKLDGCTKGNRNVPLIGKSFSKHRNMNNYTMVVYTSKKPFECPECRKRFSNHRKMDKHMMVCTGEKPDECPKIKKGFVITYLICKKNRILKPVIFPKVSQLVGIIQHQLRRLRTPQTRKPTKKVGFLSSSTAAQQIRHLLGTRPPHGGHHTKLQRLSEDLEVNTNPTSSKTRTACPLGLKTTMKTPDLLYQLLIQIIVPKTLHYVKGKTQQQQSHD
ncbi:zinc finger protein 30-like [Procambarus clarkii]|uniref:zinc finger protein 30-like n=1 Tax=Procambarus clarkii TaxID=6728 RepID=UPI003742F390